MCSSRNSKGLNIRELSLQVSLIAVATIKVGDGDNTSNKIALTASQSQHPQFYEYLIVLDFEATCWDTKEIHTHKPQHEIIEFAAVLLRISTREILSTFKEYVHPTENPTLTPFCTSLTGINQSTVDKALNIKQILPIFDAWLQENISLHNLCFPSKFKSKGSNSLGMCTFATWSDWDLGTCLKEECTWKGINREDVFNHWIDVRKAFVDLYNACTPIYLMDALRTLEMTFVGVEHSGIDDARHTAFLINRMLDDGLHL